MGAWVGSGRGLGCKQPNLNQLYHARFFLKGFNISPFLSMSIFFLST